MRHKSLQMRLTVWFAASLLTVVAVFIYIVHSHLRTELREEQWERVHPDNPDFVLHGSYSEAEINDIVGELLQISLAYLFPVAALAAGIGLYLARKSLLPVDAINGQLAGIGGRSLGKRIDVSEADKELQTLSNSINALLERIEHSYRDVSEFAARVAHELRTPLTLMRLQLEDSATRIDPCVAESLQDELRRMEAYVEQCLLIARAERGQIEVHKEPVQLGAIVSDVVEPFLLLAREQQRHIEINDGWAGTVNAAPWIVGQLVHNLLSNALAHGTGTIEVSIEGSPTSSLTVRNTIREPRHSGTGLGLRIVNALIEAHGDLRLETTEVAGVHTSALIWDATAVPEPC